MANNMELSHEKRTLTVAEIAKILNIGKTSTYELVKKGYFHSVKIGTSIRISKNHSIYG